MRTLIVVAHYDDETLGASRLISSSPESCYLLHATDSAPLEPNFARKAGFSSRKEYRSARQMEFRAAMAVAGIDSSHCFSTGIHDQGVTEEWSVLCTAVHEYCHSLSIDRVLTHAYEGGHADHDAVAFAVQRSDFGNVYEMPLYNAWDSSFSTYTFLPQAGAGEAEIFELTEAEQERKKSMLACYRSQKQVVERFPVDREMWRRAPRYDFSAAPHEGKLYYESRPHGLPGAAWRQRLRFY